MTHEETFAKAYAALDLADETVQKLQDGCCRPSRSPRMETLVDTLTSARKEIGEMNGDSDTADNVVEILEDAGSQLGYLQVNCCSPGRMKLYITTLDSLAKVQRGVNRAIKKGH